MIMVIIIIDKETRKYILTDMSVPSNQNIMVKEIDKLKKYSNF